jgi:hypothetical protein
MTGISLVGGTELLAVVTVGYRRPVISLAIKMATVQKVQDTGVEVETDSKMSVQKLFFEKTSVAGVKGILV